MIKLPRNPTRSVRIGSITIGDNNPIAVQTMCSTKTTNVEETLAQISSFESVGADIVRVAIDNSQDAKALISISGQTPLNLVVDIQENYRLAKTIAPHVQKIRYNPGHLYHIERNKPWQDKVKFLAEQASEHDCALRVGINCGSIDPIKKQEYKDDLVIQMIEGAYDHCELLDSMGFTRYCVSLKDSDPNKVIELNRRFSEQLPYIPLHLGVTEAGMPPDGTIKTRIAFEQLISKGIGDTIRVSLTLSNEKKAEEIVEGRKILEDIANGKVRSVVRYEQEGLNIISCPSCSRVENESFVDLSRQVKLITEYARQHDITIAVMGCRVNGPGETDAADLGLWCGPHYVNLKRGPKKLGAFKYDEILPRLRKELDSIIAEQIY